MTAAWPTVHQTKGQPGGKLLRLKAGEWAELWAHMASCCALGQGRIWGKCRAAKAEVLARWHHEACCLLHYPLAAEGTEAAC